VTPPFVSGLILAAGRSSRLGRPKQLLPLAGRPLLAHVLENAAVSALAEVVLVLGHEAARIGAAVDDLGQRVVVNPDFAAGQSTSLRAGLAALDPAAAAVVVLLGDQPQVGPEVVDALIGAFRAGAGPIVAPRYGGRRGNPILFARALFPELAGVAGDEGARGIVRARAAEVVEVPVGDGPPPPDVDTEEDYAALLAAWPGRPT
jgi:molybdenum cofactor cytidylyltransferase